MLARIKILGSSSAGNGYILYYDDKTVYQLDAGMKNENPEEIKKLFISHVEHSDHGKYIKDFNEEKTEIIKPFEMARDKDDWYSFDVPHKVLNNGYVINHDGTKLAYITDCGDYTQVDQNLSDIDILLVECNWDKFLIDQQVIPKLKHATYAFSKLGHMSNLDCLNALSKWKINKDCKIIFIHKSGAHARYETTYKMFDGLPNPKLVAKGDTTVYCKSWKMI